jgi:hypothetical protein
MHMLQQEAKKLLFSIVFASEDGSVIDGNNRKQRISL